MVKYQILGINSYQHKTGKTYRTTNVSLYYSGFQKRQKSLNLSEVTKFVYFMHDNFSNFNKDDNAIQSFNKSFVFDFKVDGETFEYLRINGKIPRITPYGIISDAMRDRK